MPVTGRPSPRLGPWQPMEFIAAVDPAGLVGPLVPTARSGVDEVDAYFGRYLADTPEGGPEACAGLLPHRRGPLNSP